MVTQKKKRTTLKIEIPYYVKGQKHSKFVDIHYVNYNVQNKYQSVVERVQNGTKLVEAQRSILREMGALVHSKLKLKDIRAEMQVLSEKKKYLEDQVASLEPVANNTYDTLVNLAIELLEINGCLDPELLHKDFWTNKVDVQEIWSFMGKAISKDLIIQAEDTPNGKELDSVKK